MPKVIIFFSIANFSFNWLRRQQIVTRLAEKGFKIIFIHPSLGLSTGLIKTPLAIFKILINPHLLNLTSSLKLSEKQRGNLFLLDYPIPVPHRGRFLSHVLGIFFPFLLFLIRILLGKIADGKGFILYVTNPRLVQLFSHSIMHPLIRIYDCSDNWFYLCGAKDKRLIEEERRVIQGSDLVFAVDKHLFEKCKKLNLNTFLVPNAADTQHFNSLADENTLIPSDIAYIKHPIIGYVGHLGYIDFSLLGYLASKHPEWNIVLIGSFDHLRIDKYRYNNIHFLGYKRYSDLPIYNKSFDICIVPFLLNEATLWADPIKVYEYLASGKPVVATDMPTLRKMEQFVSIGRDQFEFERKIIEALHDDNGKLSEARRRFAEENSWNIRIEEILKLLNQTIKHKHRNSESNTT